MQLSNTYTYQATTNYQLILNILSWNFAYNIESYDNKHLYIFEASRFIIYCVFALVKQTNAYTLHTHTISAHVGTLGLANMDKSIY